MEYLLFPKKTYYLTQAFGKGTYSHQYRKAIDVSAAGNGSRQIYAPFSGKIKKKYVSNPRIAYSCWLVSDYKVMCADGNERYAVAMFTHPNGIANIKNGQHFNQGQYMFDDGTTGGCAAHLDLEIAVYDNVKDIKVDWYNNNGQWTLCNAVDPFKYMVMANDCKVLNTYYAPFNKNYVFKKVSEVKLKPQPAPAPTDYFIANKSYKLNAGKYLRFSPQLGNNVVPYSIVDPGTKKISNNIAGSCQLKAGTVIEPERIVKEANGRIWASYGNCWWCCQNVDSTKNATKI